MKYETFCVDYHPHTAAMAIAAAEKANELDAKGYKVLSYQFWQRHYSGRKKRGNRMKNLLYILICSDFVLAVLSLAGLLFRQKCYCLINK